MTDLTQTSKPTDANRLEFHRGLSEVIKLYIHREDIPDYLVERLATYAVGQALAATFLAGAPPLLVGFIAGYLAKELLKEFGIDGDDLFKPLNAVAEVLGFDTSGMQPIKQTVFRGKDNKDDVITGNELNNTIYGLAGNDVLSGGIGNDRLEGGAGDDVLDGGTGNDTLLGAEGADILIGGAGADILNGGPKEMHRDTAAYFGSNAAVNVDLGTGKASGGHATGDKLISIENLTGSDFDDVLIGSDLENVLIGGRGNDLIAGRHGDDVLIGDEGDDILAGEQGADTLYGGFGSDRLYGSSENDTLYGGASVDFLYGGSGNDVLDGGDGVDWADFSDLTRAVTVDLIRGIATSGIEVDSLFAIENAVGTRYGDRFIGDDLNNVFDGHDGDDTMVASRGNDIFRGLAGNDTADYSGLRDQSLNPVAVTVNLAFSSATATMSHAGSNYTKSDYLMEVENAIGSGANDTLIGSNGNNRLDGGLGADRMEGGFGDDTYVVDSYGDVVIEKPTSFGFAFMHYGIDTIETALSSYSLANIANVENLVGTATTGQVLTGNAEYNRIIGGIGDDTIDGGTGNDTLTGGYGDDRFIFRAGGGADVITDFASGFGGIDEISLQGLGITSFAQAMAFAREDDGSTVFDFGNGDTLTLHNVRKANLVASDLGFADPAGEPPVVPLPEVTPAPVAMAPVKGVTFSQTVGIDTLTVAGKGKVTMPSFDAGAASIEIWSGNRAAVMGDAAANVFDFSALRSVSGITFVDGGAGDDVLIGSAFADALRGGAGNDTLSGGAGDDTLSGGAGRDTFMFAPGFGNDRITDFAAAGKVQDVIQFDRSVFADFADVMAHAAQAGSAVVITDDAGNSLTLDKVKLAALGADDFAFV